MAIFATISLTSFLVAASPQFAPGEPEAIGPPAVGGKPVEMAIDFYVMDCASPVRSSGPPDGPSPPPMGSPWR